MLKFISARDCSRLQMIFFCLILQLTDLSNWEPTHASIVASNMEGSLSLLLANFTSFSYQPYSLVWLVTSIIEPSRSKLNGPCSYTVSTSMNLNHLNNCFEWLALYCNLSSVCWYQTQARLLMLGLLEASRGFNSKAHKANITWSCSWKSCKNGHTLPKNFITSRVREFGKTVAAAVQRHSFLPSCRYATLQISSRAIDSHTCSLLLLSFSAGANQMCLWYQSVNWETIIFPTL